MNSLRRRMWLRMNRSHFFLEILISLLIIACLSAFAISEMHGALVKAKRLGAFSDFSTARTALMETYALSGNWPERLSLSFEHYQTPIHQMEIKQGVINLLMQGRNSTSQVLSLRPATSASNATVLWVCGSAVAPTGMQVAGANVSTLRRDELYIACR